MAVYGYLRVSTDQQDYNSQKQGVDHFATINNWTIDKYITDDGVSGAKDPYKRNLGELLTLLKDGDVVIASEMSRLGRDLLMVMDILNYCMKVGATVYTVKDNYKLSDDVQSKVLAFAFGLSAEIERKMIQARTIEGLRLRVKKGVLLGRPLGAKSDIPFGEDKKEEIIHQYKLGVPYRRMQQNLGINRNVIQHRLIDWGVITDPKQIENYEKYKRQLEERHKAIREGKDLQTINFTPEERQRILGYIVSNLTIPEIHKKFKQFTYEEVYNTILEDEEFNRLYRQYGQKLLTSSHRGY